MKRYWKGSDMRLNVNITDKNGEEIPLSSIVAMTIYLFTTGKEYVEYTYPQSILADEKGIYIPINENALSCLRDGFLRWEAHFKVKDGEWADGKDIVKGCRTDIFVKTPRDYVAKPNVQEKEITITENGEYEVLPDAGYEGISRMTVNVNLDVNPYYEEGFKKFLKKEASGKLMLPIESMDTPYLLFKQTGITEVVVPEGATSIPNGFFQYCTSLAKITYPDSITEFGNDIYGGIDIEKRKSFPLPPYLKYIHTPIYYMDREVFNVPKYINEIQYIYSYNDGIAKRLNFKGNLCRFYFASFRAEEMDFRYNVQVPRFSYTSIYTGMTKVIVPESLYDTWITTSPWSNYSDIIESVPDTDYFVPYQTKSGNDISLTTGVKEDRYAVISYTDKKIHLRGTPWQMADIINSNDITYVDFAASNLEVPAFSGLFRGASQMTGCTLPPNKPLSCREMFNGCTSLTTIPEIDTSNVNDMYYMFYACSSLTVIPPIDTSNANTMVNMFAACTSLTSVPEMNTSQVTNMYGMFQYCSSLTTVPEMDTSKVTDMSVMFQGCTSLTSVPEMDTSKVTTMFGMFDDSFLLTDLGGFIGLKVDLYLGESNLLSHDSLMNVITKAADVTASPATLTLESTNLAKLSDAEKGIATGKGWTLA